MKTAPILLTFITILSFLSYKYDKTADQLLLFQN